MDWALLLWFHVDLPFLHHQAYMVLVYFEEMTAVQRLLQVPLKLLLRPMGQPFRVN